MKKLFFAMAAMAAMLTSCSKDDAISGLSHGKVTFEVSTPELATRAYGDGTTATNLYYAVYDVTEDPTNGGVMVKTNVKIEGEQEATPITINGTANVPIDLVEGRQYEVAFWAESENSPYTFTPASKTVSYTDVEALTANNEAYDAFFAYVPKSKVVVGSSISVELKRPFAQLNVATNDTTKAADLGVNVKETGIVVNAYTSLNLETGAVSDPDELTFNMTNVGDDTATEVVEHTLGTITANGSYNWLTMNYILVNERENIDITFTFSDEKGKADYERPYAAVPVQRNHRTNVIGSILTSPTDFNVEIKPEMETTEHNVGITRKVANAADFVGAVEELNDENNEITGATLILEGNIDLNDLFSLSGYANNSTGYSAVTRASTKGAGLIIPAGKSLTLDLNGCTISMTKECDAHFSMIENKGNLTINDSSADGTGKISFKDTSAGDPSFGWGSYTISNYGGNLVVENGTIEHLGEQNPGNGQPNQHMYCAIFHYDGSTTINGGTISTPTYRSVRLWSNDMTINGGNFVGQVWVQAVNDSANLTINGGTFAPCGNDSSCVFVTNSGKSVNFAVTGGTFTTMIGMSEPIAAVSGGTFHDSSVFNYLADNAEINLGSDITASAIIFIRKSLKVNGNDHKISSPATRIFRLTEGNIDVVFENLDLVSTAERVGTNDIRGVSVDDVQNVALTLNNCSVDFEHSSANDWAYAVNVVGGAGHKVTINGGEYEGANVVNVRGAENIVTVNNATLTSNYPDNDTYYGACIWVQQNQGSKVFAKGNIFNGSHAIAFNIGNTELTESDNIDNCVCVIKNETNGVYKIYNPGGLKWFASDVNAGNTYAGKSVTLMADIDLKNEQWTPIGYWQEFMGIFDGCNHTISNLKHHTTEADCYIGLFGCINNATIKNLTLNNADINLINGAENTWAGGHSGTVVGLVVGESTLENINVIGTIKVEGSADMLGAQRIGAVIGGNSADFENIGNFTLKNIKVNADAGSYVKGNAQIGGIAGALYGEVAFEDCSSNIDVTANLHFAGGIIGLSPFKASFANCETSGKISVAAGRVDHTDDIYRVGGIAGGWDDNKAYTLTLTDCSYSGTLSGQDANGNKAASFDCGGYVGRGYSAIVGAKVSVNGTEYVYQQE